MRTGAAIFVVGLVAFMAGCGSATESVDNNTNAGAANGGNGTSTGGGSSDQPNGGVGMNGSNRSASAVGGSESAPSATTGVASMHASVNDALEPAACAWPASLDHASAPGQCWAARAYLACTFSGGGEGCMSNNLMACTDVQGAASSCVNQCNGNEYAVSCGTINASVPLPSGCHALPHGPDAITTGCCACGS